MKLITGRTVPLSVRFCHALAAAAIVLSVVTIGEAQPVSARPAGCWIVSDPATTASRCTPDANVREHRGWQNCQQQRSGDFVYLYAGWRRPGVTSRTPECDGLIIARGAEYKQ